MHTIIPLAGNGLVSPLRTTSLTIAVPFSLELYGHSTDIANALFLPMPVLLVIATWYLVTTLILMIGQFYFERYFVHGTIRQLTARQLAALADAGGMLPVNARVIDKDEEHFYREDPQ